MSVGVLYDSFSNNIGDQAMLDANRLLLARHGFHDVRTVDLFSPDPQEFSAVVVGGGELIRPEGDIFYDRFRQADATALVAAGVWETADNLDYLRNYDFVTARTHKERDVLRQYVPDAGVMPCPTMALPMDDRTVTLDEAGLIGVHLVPAAVRAVPSLMDRVNAIAGRKVMVPFTRYLADRSFMSALPVGNEDNIWLPDTLTPVQMRGAVAQLGFVVASSLHLTLFALSAGVPFVSYAQPKVAAYLKDRGLEQLIFDDDASLERALEAARDVKGELLRIAQTEREAVDDEYARLARILRDRADQRVTIPPMSANPEDDRWRLHMEQVAQVHSGRDVLINTLVYRSAERDHYLELSNLQSACIAQLEGSIAALQDENRTRLGRLWYTSHARRVLRSVAKKVFAAVGLRA